MHLEKSSIAVETLQKAIKNWDVAWRVKELEEVNMFRYKIKKIKRMSFSFIENCIKYAIMEKFAWAFQQPVKPSLWTLSYEIKGEYQKMYFDGACKNDFRFYFLMVLTTRIISYFIKRQFNGIEVNDTLESEIFIILMYIIVGVSVSSRSFQTVLDKYILKSNKKINLDFKSLESVPRLEKQDKMKQSRFITKSNLSGSGSTNNSQQQKHRKKRDGGSYGNMNALKKMSINLYQSCEDQFRSSLKSQLYVKPLPPPVRKKMTVRELDLLNQMQLGADLLPQLDKFSKNRYLNSDQLSESFQCSVNFNERTTKLQGSFRISRKEHNTLHCCGSLPKLLKRKAANLLSTAKEEAPIALKTRKKDAKQWKEIIANLKKNVYEKTPKLQENNYHRLGMEEEHNKQNLYEQFRAPQSYKRQEIKSQPLTKAAKPSYTSDRVMEHIEEAYVRQRDSIQIPDSQLLCGDMLNIRRRNPSSVSKHSLQKEYRAFIQGIQTRHKIVNNSTFIVVDVLGNC